jgi:hypothetical protein
VTTAIGDEEVELERWEPSRDIVVAWVSVGLAASLPVLALFAALAAAAGGGSASLRLDAWTFAAQLALAAGVLALHEVVHGVAVLAAGRRPSFGAGLLHGMPYLSTTSNSVFSRDQFIAIALAPLVVISAGGAAVMFAAAASSPALVVPLTLNAVGAVGDLNLVLVALRYPARVLIRDERVGVTILGLRADARPRAPVAAAPDRRLRFFVALLRTAPLAYAAWLIVSTLSVFALRAAGVRSFDLPGVLAMESGPPPQVSVGVVPLVIALALAIALAFAMSARR